MYNGFYQNGPDYASVTRAVQLLRGKAPMVRVISIGQSVLGREIYALAIGGFESATLYVGGVQGTQWITTSLLYRFAQELVEKVERGGNISDIDVPKAFEKRSLIVVPCLNPDGVEIVLRGRDGAVELEEWTGHRDLNYRLWEGNARGMDLERALMEEKTDRKKGRPPKNKELLETSPFLGGFLESELEPEIQAITGFCRDYDVHKLYVFGAPGNEVFYRGESNTPFRSQLMAQVLASSGGYKVNQSADPKLGGGLKNWYIQNFARPGFTVKVGRGKAPPGITQLDLLYQQTREMLMMGVII